MTLPTATATKVTIQRQVQSADRSLTAAASLMSPPPIASFLSANSPNTAMEKIAPADNAGRKRISSIGKVGVGKRERYMHQLTCDNRHVNDVVRYAY